MKIQTLTPALSISSALLAAGVSTLLATSCGSSTTTAAAGPSSPASAPALALPEAPDPQLAARLDAVVDAALQEQRIVGAVVLVARDGKLVYHRAAGLADREAQRPMREDTLFRLASITKPFTATAALALVDRGALSLDDTVDKYLPELAFHTADGKPAAITIRQLLTHTSGLGYPFNEAPDGPLQRAQVSSGLDQPGLSFADNGKRLAAAALAAAPGERFHYSLSLDVLGEVVARAAGAPFPEALQQLVGAPLGLRDTRFTPVDRERLAAAYSDGKPPVLMSDDNAFVAYGPGKVPFAPARAWTAGSYPSGGAGLIGTAAEVLRLLETLRQGGAPLLKRETTSAGLSDQLGSASPVELGLGLGFGFFGAVVRDPDKASTPLHPGAVRWGGAYGASWYIDPVAKVTVVGLTNTAFEGMAGKFQKDLEAAVVGQ